jgi:hypothetical protein
MANYNITLTFTKNGYTTFTQNVQTGDTVTCATGNALNTWSSGSPNNCSASPTSGSPGTSSVISSFSGSSYSILFSYISGGNVYGATVSGTVTTTASAPVISSVTNNNAAAADVTATVNLSSSGSGGTALEYAQTTANTLPSTGWQASASFTHPRGTTRYYWASRNKNTSLYSSSTSHTVGYIAPDSSITTTTNSPIAVGAGTHQVTIANGDANTTYHVRSASYTGSILATGTGNVTITVSDSSAAGSTTTYYITATRATSTGGDNVHVNATTYSITRNNFDTTPDAFTFTDVTNAVTNTLYTSNEVTITGIDTTVSVSISGGQYRRFTGGAWGAYTSAAGNAVSGDKFQLQRTSSSTSGTAVNSTLTVGGTSDTWTVTTSGGSTDTTPDQFTFTSITGAARSTVYTSNSITITGINASTAVSITGGEYEKNASGSWVTANGTAVVNDTFRVRHTSSASYSTTTSTSLTVGGVVGTYNVTTLDDPVTSTYGFEVYNSSGIRTLSVSTRTPRLVLAGNVSITVGTTVATYSSSPLTVTGYSPTDDSWQVLIAEHGDYNSQLSYYYTGASGSVTFKIDRLTAGGVSQSRNVYYFVLRN